jgi:Zn-dependent peptidase ImmA (M78 family)
VGRLTTAALGALVVAGACRERASAVRQDAALRDLVQQRIPGIETATGLTFKHKPNVARRTREQVRDYILRKLDADLPPAELAALEAAYKLFGFIPDTVDLREMLLRVLGEQIAGYYDPDSTTLFVVADVDSFLLRTTLSHELVHALQDQYMPLDSILSQKRQNDRAMAAKAILEGQATLAQTLAMMPEQRRENLRNFWEQRTALEEQYAQMKEYVGAPLWLREWLVFPYLAGADFVLWFESQHPGQHPFNGALPVSTEQILHTDRYAAGDGPTALEFTSPSPDSLRYEDGLGEFETRVLFQQLLGDRFGARAAAFANGWDGDRYQLLGGDGALALVWYSVWDDAASADRFERSLRRLWVGRQRPGREARVERVSIEGRPGVRLVEAPAAWKHWKRVPGVKVVGGPPSEGREWSR